MLIAFVLDRGSRSRIPMDTGRCVGFRSPTDRVSSLRPVHEKGGVSGHNATLVRSGRGTEVEPYRGRRGLPREQRGSIVGRPHRRLELIPISHPGCRITGVIRPHLEGPSTTTARVRGSVCRTVLLEVYVTRNTLLRFGSVRNSPILIRMAQGSGLRAKVAGRGLSDALREARNRDVTNYMILMQ
jgi:hypothetical protein